MRTTVTLDDDVVARLRAVMRERDISFEQALNDILRAGLGEADVLARRFRQETFHAEFQPGVNRTKALALAGDIEDEATLREIELGR